MIPSKTLSNWPTIYAQIGEVPPRRGRGRCALCGSRTGFSCHEEKGFNCFACGAKGDKISFIQQYYKTEFKGALSFFGLTPGIPRPLDPDIVKQRQAEQALQTWAKRRGRLLRDLFYYRQKCITYGKALLSINPEDEIGWSFLELGYKGIPLDELENRLDRLNGKIEQQWEAYKEVMNCQKCHRKHFRKSIGGGVSLTRKPGMGLARGLKRKRLTNSSAA